MASVSLNSTGGAYMLLAACLLLMPAASIAQKKKKEAKPPQPAASQLPQQGKNELSEAVRRYRINELFYEATIKQAQQNNREAVQLYQEVLRLEPSNAASNYGIATILLEEGVPDKALPFAEKALAMDLGNMYYYQHLAHTFESLRRNAEALAVLEKAEKKFPDELELKFHLADLHRKLKNNTRALQMYDSLEVRTGLVEELAQRRFDIYKDTNQPDKAIGEVRRLIRLYPDETRYYRELYQAYAFFNQYDNAAAALEEWLALNPYEGDALFLLADHHSRAGKNEKADHYLKRAFGSSAVSLESKMIYLDRLMPQYAVSDSVQRRVLMYADLLIKQNPSSAQVLFLKGSLLARKNQVDSARVFYRRSLAIDASNRRAWEELLAVDFTVNNMDSLRRDSDDALEVFPSHVFFNYVAGAARYQQKAYKEATVFLEKVTKVGTSDMSLLVQIYTLLGDSYHYLNDHTRSDQSYDKALEIDPSNPTALNNYAYFLSVRNVRLDDAARMVAQAVNAEPNNASFQDTYGWVLFRQGKYQDALSWLEKAYKQGASAEVSEHLGDVYYMLGNTERAKQLWLEAQQKGESNAKLLDKIKNGRL